MGDQGAMSILAIVAPLPLGIALLVAQRLISGPRDPLREDPVNLVLSTAGWTMVVVGLIWPLVQMLLVFSIFLVAIGIFVLIEGWRARRASQQSALLWLLVISIERSMPLVPAIEAFAAEEGGLFAARARRLAGWLAAGEPLPVALGLCPRVLPAYALPMIRVGSQAGGLAAALRQAAATHNQNAPLLMSLVGKISYLAVLPFLGCLVVAFIVSWILPKFCQIFQDFDMKLPPMTNYLIRTGSFFFNNSYLLLPLFLAFALLFGYTILRYFGVMQWDIPPINRLTRRLDSARILEALAVVARQQRPLSEGIAAMAVSYPKRAIRRRLRKAVFDIGAGEDWAESLARRRLIHRADRAVLQAAQRVGNLPWAMQEMAESARRRFFYRLQGIIQTVFPVAVVGFGLTIMFIVVALFMPLIKVIQRLTW